jgi:hypothetical protein
VTEAKLQGLDIKTDEKGSLKSETVKYGQRHIQKTDASFRQRGCHTRSSQRFMESEGSLCSQ